MESSRPKIKAQAFYRVFYFILPLVFTLTLSSCITDGLSLPLPQSEKPVKLKASALDAYKHGDLLYCKIGIGSARFKEDWREFKDKGFVVIKNSRSNVNLAAKYAELHATMQAIFDKNGQKIILCPIPDAGENRMVECLNLYFIDKDLDFGIKRSVDIRNFIQGGAISCAYSRENLKSLPPPR